MQAGDFTTISDLLPSSKTSLFYREVDGLTYESGKDLYIIEDNVSKVVNGEIDVSPTINEALFVLPLYIVADVVEEGIVVRRIDCTWIVVRDPILIGILGSLHERVFKEPDNLYKVRDLVLEILDRLHPRDIGVETREELQTVIRKYISIAWRLALINFGKTHRQ